MDSEGPPYPLYLNCNSIKKNCLCCSSCECSAIVVFLFEVQVKSIYIYTHTGVYIYIYIYVGRMLGHSHFSSRFCQISRLTGFRLQGGVGGLGLPGPQKYVK